MNIVQELKWRGQKDNHGNMINTSSVLGSCL